MDMPPHPMIRDAVFDPSAPPMLSEHACHFRNFIVDVQKMTKGLCDGQIFDLDECRDEVEERITKYWLEEQIRDARYLTGKARGLDVHVQLRPGKKAIWWKTGFRADAEEIPLFGFPLHAEIIGWLGRVTGRTSSAIFDPYYVDQMRVVVEEFEQALSRTRMFMKHVERALSKLDIEAEWVQGGARLRPASLTRLATLADNPDVERAFRGRR